LIIKQERKWQAMLQVSMRQAQGLFDLRALFLFYTIHSEKNEPDGKKERKQRIENKENTFCIVNSNTYIIH